MRRLNLLQRVACLVVLCGFGGCLGSNPDTKPSAEENAASVGSETTPETKAEKLSFAADEFLRLFQEDQTALMNKCMNKTIELHGRVGGVGRFSYPGGYLYVNGLKMETEDKEPWSKVLPGQEVVVEAPYDVGGMKMKIVKVEGERLTVKAEDLSAEQQADREALQGKYQDKWLEIQGTVVKKEQEPAEAMHLFLAGQGEATVRCVLHYDFNKEGEAIAVGDQVRLAGRFKGDDADLVDCMPISK